jgi:hypothetical protein
MIYTITHLVALLHRIPVFECFVVGVDDVNPIEPNQATIAV